MITQINSDGINAYSKEMFLQAEIVIPAQSLITKSTFLAVKVMMRKYLMTYTQ